MTDKKLSQLPVGTAITSADLFYSAQSLGGGSYTQVQQPASALATFCGGGGGGNVSNSGTPTVSQYARWVTATTIEGVAPATVVTDIGAQPLDADLTSLAAASGTNTIYYRSAANTWSPVTVSTGLTFSGGNLAAAAAGTPRTQTRFTAGATLATEQIVNSSCAAPATFVLPLANTRAGQPLTIKDVGGLAFTNNITINRSGSDTIDGQTSYVLQNNYAGVTFMPANDGTSAGWYVT